MRAWRCLAAAIAAALPALALDLVRNGKPAAAIVIPEQPLAVESFAAAELQYHIAAASGVRLAILSETGHSWRGARVYLGRCQAGLGAGADPSALAGNGYVLKTARDGLFIAGNDAEGDPLGLDVRAGTLFGVYELLENHLGVRWVWPGKLGEVIPRRTTISLPALNARVEPLLWFKEWRGGLPGGQWGERSPKDEFSREQARWLRRHRFGRSRPPNYRHAFGQYWSRFSESHPEYFSMTPDGTRGLDPLNIHSQPAGQWSHLCLSEPALWKQIIDDWKAAGMPEYLNICENDGNASCSCPRCLAWDAPDPELSGPFEHRLDAARAAFERKDGGWTLRLGSMSNRFARFWKIVSEDARTFRPDVKVVSYAYANYKNPPILPMQLSENVLIGFVPKTPFPYDSRASERIQKEWSGWSATGGMLFLRPNLTLHFHNLPAFYARYLGEDLKYAMAHALKGADFDSLTGQYATQGPSLYMLAKILNYPALPVQAVIDEFCAAFGPAHPAVQEYFEHWEAVTRGFSTEGRVEIVAVKKKYGSLLFAGLLESSEICTPEAMSRAWTILDKALSSAGADPTAKARVEWLRLGLRHVDLVLAAEKAHERGVDTGDRSGFLRAHRALTEFRQRHANEMLGDFGFLAGQERRVWKVDR